MHAKSLNPAEIEQWLARVERHMDNFAADIRQSVPKEIAGAIIGISEAQRAWLIELLSELMRREVPFTQSDLDSLAREMAAAMRAAPDG